MGDDFPVTYRLVALDDPNNTGNTAATEVLAKLAPGGLVRGNSRLGIERTEWVRHFEKMKIQRSILIAAEEAPGEWEIGV